MEWHSAIKSAIVAHTPEIASINKHIHENPGRSPSRMHFIACEEPRKCGRTHVLTSNGLVKSWRMKNTKLTMPSSLLSNLSASM